MSGVLLATNSGNEQLQEAVGVDVDAYLRGRLDFVEAFDNLAVTVQHIALDRAATVGNGFTSSEFASGFYINVHRRRFHEGGNRGDTYRERVKRWGAAGT